MSGITLALMSVLKAGDHAVFPTQSTEGHMNSLKSLQFIGVLKLTLLMVPGKLDLITTRRHYVQYQGCIL